MKNVLQRKVLVLNRVWQAINQRSVQDALVQMATDVVTALDIQPDGTMIPVKWEDWLKLPLLEEDEVVHTTKLKIRMPTVIVTCKYSKVPKRRPRFTLRNVAKTYDNRCAYTGRILKPSEWSKDHVLPLSRGGKDVPENVVLADKIVNNRKGDKLPHEAGLPTPIIRKLVDDRFEIAHPHHALFISQ
jgi:5-methylcytosine-specific restriction endonuclease McrA